MGQESANFLAIAIANFVPLSAEAEPSTGQPSPQSVASTSAHSDQAFPSQLPLFVGDRLRILCFDGHWFYGHKIKGPERIEGIFPKSHVKALGTLKCAARNGNKNGQIGEDESREMVAEISRSTKVKMY